MLIFDTVEIGNKLFAIRKRAGLTQAEVAEKAGISDRAYADIERGTVNMRIETVLKICGALSITPNDILTENSEKVQKEKEIMEQLNSCSNKEKGTALKLLAVYLESIIK